MIVLLLAFVMTATAIPPWAHTAYAASYSHWFAHVEISGGEGNVSDPAAGYELIRGFARHQETDGDDYDSVSAFYYSDAFFDDDPEHYNDHLATASINMAYADVSR